MDTETRLNVLEDRIEKLEALASQMMSRAEVGLARLETHPIFGSIIRMFKE